MKEYIDRKIDEISYWKQQAGGWYIKSLLVKE